MECEMQGGSLRYYEQTGALTCTREETGELIVPDSMPDVLTVVGTDGQVFLRGKEAKRGSVVITGVFELTVLVKTEGSEELKPLYLDIPFDAEQSCPGITETDRLTVSLGLISAEARMLNSRKLVLRGEACIRVSSWASRELNWVKQLSAEGCLLEQKQECFTADPVTEVTERTFSLLESQTLTAGKPQADAVLYCRTVMQQEDSSIVGSKLILRGTALVSVTYLSVLGNPAAVDFRLPWSVILELDGLEGEKQSRSVLALTGCTASVKDDGAVSVELGAVAQAVVRTRTQITGVTDAYGVDCKLQLRQERAELELSSVPREHTETLSVRLEQAGRTTGILNLSADCGRPRQEQGQLLVPVTVKALCVREDGAVLLTGRSELRCTGTAETETSTGELYASAGGSGMEVRVPICLRDYEIGRMTAVLVTGAEAEKTEPETDTGVTLLRVRDGDTVWSLGKTGGLSGASIRSYNGLEADEEPEPGTLLLLAR